MDKIRIQDLEVYGKHGVFPEEKKLGQKFLISVTLYTDLREAGKTDQLDKSIHYGLVCQKITQWFLEETYDMLEKIAETLCKKLLLEYHRLQKVQLEIKKPWAPIGLPLDYVSISIERKWNKVFLALGSNLGNREEYLDLAVSMFRGRQDVRVVAVAPYIQTEPYGENAKYEFLNSCMEIDTLMTSEELLAFCQEIEQKGERVRMVHWGPRTLDLDILFYNDEIISTKNLCVPHTEIEKREFVLEPMCSIAPYFRHPISKKTMLELLQQLQEKER